jgi:hypothetical protein
MVILPKLPLPDTPLLVIILRVAVDYLNLDVAGNIRIWDTTQAENILKTETRALSGRINDLDWDFESKRLIAVGEGKDKYFFFT